MAEENDLGPFREGEAGPAIFQEGVFRGHNRSVSRHDIGGDLFSVIPVFERHGHREFDCRVAFEHVVNLQRGNIDAAANNQFLQPARNKEKRPPGRIPHDKPLVA